MCIRDRYRTVPGLEHCEIVRNAYAIEYDCINAKQLNPSLEFKNISGSLCRIDIAALIPAISPWEAASSYPLLPLNGPPLNRPMIFLNSREGFNLSLIHI